MLLFFFLKEHVTASASPVSFLLPLYRMTSVAARCCSPSTSPCPRYRVASRAEPCSREPSGPAGTTTWRPLCSSREKERTLRRCARTCVCVWVGGWVGACVCVYCLYIVCTAKPWLAFDSHSCTCMYLVVGGGVVVVVVVLTHHAELGFVVCTILIVCPGWSQPGQNKYVAFG